MPVGHRNYTRPWLALLALFALPARRTVQVGSGAADVHALYNAEPPLHRHATASAFDRHFRASTHFLIGTFSLSNCRAFYGFLALCEARFSCKSQFNTVHRVLDPSKMLRITTSLAPAFLALSSRGHAVLHFSPLYLVIRVAANEKENGCCIPFGQLLSPSSLQMHSCCTILISLADYKGHCNFDAGPALISDNG